MLGWRARRRGAEPEARSLSICMIRRLDDQLGISADVLIRPARKSAA
jgi:HTH-type transcriptional regulator/antitoxin HigA